jgi:small GTP-binding protein
MEYIRNSNTNNINVAKEEYRKIISSSNDLKDLALAYIEICEQLQSVIIDSEQNSLFPITFALLNQWLHEQSDGKKFEPNIPSLFKAIDQDLVNQLTDSVRAPRVKIGVVGYTSAGKSTLINRLLGFKFLTEEGAASVSTNKSTYFPLQFDRKEPLFDPTDSTKRTWVTFVDIQGEDEGKTTSSAKISAGNYLDELRKADCDIYLVVFNKELTDEQKEWINQIEEHLNRICLVVQSKVDVEFLEKFLQKSGQFYSQMTKQQRIELGKSVIEELRQESNFHINNEDQTENQTSGEGQSGCNGYSSSENSSKNNDNQPREVFFVSCNYKPPNIDALELQKEQPFDFTELYNKLGQLAPAIH